MRVQSGVSRRVWLHVLREGGWSTASECAAAESLARDENVHQVLYHLVTSKCLERRKVEGGSWEYAVTRNCKVATGVTLADLSGVMA